MTQTGKNSISSLNSTPLSCLMERIPLTEACKQKEVVQRVIFLIGQQVKVSYNNPSQGLNCRSRTFNKSAWCRCHLPLQSITCRDFASSWHLPSAVNKEVLEAGAPVWNQSCISSSYPCQNEREITLHGNWVKGRELCGKGLRSFNRPATNNYRNTTWNTIRWQIGYVWKTTTQPGSQISAGLGVI